MSKELPPVPHPWSEFPPPELQRKRRRDGLEIISMTRFIFLVEVHQWELDHPAEPLILAEVARNMGLTRQRTHQLYEGMGSDITLPLRSRGGSLDVKERREGKIERAWELANLGWNNRQIADEIGIPYKNIFRIIKFLERTRGLKELREMILLARDYRVMRWRNEGKTERQMVEESPFTRSEIASSLRRLLAADKIESKVQRKVRRTPEEFEKFLRAVRHLRNRRKLGPKRIAEIEGVEVHEVNTALQALFRGGLAKKIREVEPRKKQE